MGKWIDYFRNILVDVIDDRTIDYGIFKSVNIMLELKTKDELIKQMLVKHFDIRYSQAEEILIAAKDYHKNQK